MSSFKETYYEKLLEDDERLQGSQRKPWTRQRVDEVINNVKNARVTMLERGSKMAMDYYWLAKYDIMTTGDEEYLIFKRKTAEEPITQIVAREDYFDILLSAHKSCGHGGRDKIVYALKSKFYIPRRAVILFTALCPTCDAKRHAPRKGIVTRPIVSQDFNIRGQVDLIDFQSCSDGDFKWLLNYQDNATKFVSLRPLKSKRASEVAMELMKIFMTFGAPYILQSDNGREFTANIIEELTAMWPELKIIHGSPRRPQTQGSVERSNQDVENMLRMWMKDNKSTNWSVGCYYVQYQKNSSFHRIIGRSPYKVLFGNDPKAGLGDSTIPSALLETVESEEQLKILSEQVSHSNKIMNVQIPKDESEEARLEALQVSINEPKEAQLVDVPVSISINKPEETQLVDVPVSISINKPAETQIVDVPVSISINKPEETQLVNVPVSISINKPEETHLMDQLEDVLIQMNEGEAQHELCMNDNNIGGTFYELNDIENRQPNYNCVVCQHATSGAHVCSSCNNAVHVICGTPEGEGYGAKVLCSICNTEQEISFQRNQAHIGTKRAAEIMKDNTAKKFKSLSIGSSVLINVPKVDRGPLDTKNIRGKVVDFRNGVYRVGTKTGTIKNWFPRHELQEPVDDYYDDVLDVPISLREAVKNESMFGGQGFQKCTCKPAPKQCFTNRCACYKNKVLCGSKCHSSLTCINK